MTWEYISGGSEDQHFKIEGIDVLKYKWNTTTDETAKVINPIYGQTHGGVRDGFTTCLFAPLG